MKSLEIRKKFLFRKAIFYPTKIVILNKKKNITIPIEDIETIFYDKPNVINWFYIFSGFGSGTAKIMRIELNRNIDNNKIYRLKLDYKEVLEIQKFFQKEILITNAL